MKIHDILISCGSVTANTLIYIGDINGGIKWIGQFKILAKRMNILSLEYFSCC